jgi:hypothetical protein
MQLEELNKVMELELDGLVEVLQDTTDLISNLSEAKYLMEKRVVEVMADRGATVADTEGYMVKITTPVTYDYNILARLREITDPKLLEECYYPAGEKVVKFGEKWNMTKAKKLQSLGNEYREIVSDAKISGRPRVIIESKEEGTQKCR